MLPEQLVLVALPLPVTFIFVGWFVIVLILTLLLRARRAQKRARWVEVLDPPRASWTGDPAPGHQADRRSAKPIIRVYFIACVLCALLSAGYLLGIQPVLDIQRSNALTVGVGVLFWYLSLFIALGIEVFRGC